MVVPVSALKNQIEENYLLIFRIISGLRVEDGRAIALILFETVFSIPLLKAQRLEPPAETGKTLCSFLTPSEQINFSKTLIRKFLLRILTLIMNIQWFLVGNHWARQGRTQDMCCWDVFFASCSCFREFCIDVAKVFDSHI